MGSSAKPIKQKHLGEAYELDPTKFQLGQEGRQLMSQLQQQASGQGPSLAAEQARQAIEQQSSQLGSLMAGQAGMNPALAAQMASQQQGQMAGDAARQAAMARLTEQQGAQQQLGSLAVQQANLGAQGEMAQQSGSQFNRQLELQRLLGNQQLEAQPGFWSQMAGGALQGGSMLGAAAIMASDERLKENIKDLSDEDLNELLEAAKAKSYEYRSDSGQAPGPRVGVMANRLAATKAGSTVVREMDTPQGKRLGIDVPQGVGLSLGAIGALGARLRKLEREVKKGKKDASK